jgi:hypothetical protein
MQAAPTCEVTAGTHSVHVWQQEQVQWPQPTVAVQLPALAAPMSPPRGDANTPAHSEQVETPVRESCSRKGSGPPSASQTPYLDALASWRSTLQASPCTAMHAMGAVQPIAAPTSWSATEHDTPAKGATAGMAIPCAEAVGARGDELQPVTDWGQASGVEEDAEDGAFCKHHADPAVRTHYNMIASTR